MNKYLRDILYKHVGHNFYFDLSDEQLDNITDAMDKAIDEDRKNVTEHAQLKDVSGVDSFGESFEEFEVDKDSIINAPKLK